MVETVYAIPGCPVSMALLADLHGRPFDAVASSLAAHRPDLIAVVGDVVYGSHPRDDWSPLDTQENVRPFLEACASVAPTFLSLGNHEWMLDAEDKKAITTTGVTVLDNSWEERDGLVIAGLTSAYCLNYRRFVTGLKATGRTVERYPKKEISAGIDRRREADSHEPDTSWLADFTAAPGYKILLCHHPEY